MVQSLPRTFPLLPTSGHLLLGAKFSIGTLLLRVPQHSMLWLPALLPSLNSSWIWWPSGTFRLWTVPSVNRSVIIGFPLLMEFWLHSSLFLTLVVQGGRR